MVAEVQFRKAQRTWSAHRILGLFAIFGMLSKRKTMQSKSLILAVIVVLSVTIATITTVRVLVSSTPHEIDRGLPQGHLSERGRHAQF